MEKFEQKGYPNVSLSRQSRGESFMRRRNDYGNYVDANFYFLTQVTFSWLEFHGSAFLDVNIFS